MKLNTEIHLRKERQVLRTVLMGFIIAMIDMVPMMYIDSEKGEPVSMVWLFLGLLILWARLDLKPIPKGVLISLLAQTPYVVIFWWKEPILIMLILAKVAVLGGLLGYLVQISWNNWTRDKLSKTR